MSPSKRFSKPAGWFPRRGEVCLIELDKPRPGVVVSSDSLNAHSLDVCVLPISTKEHMKFRLRPKLHAGEAGLKHDSWVKCDQPTTLEKVLVSYPPLGRLSGESLRVIEDALRLALQL